jgi:hypothetical protein
MSISIEFYRVSRAASQVTGRLRVKLDCMAEPSAGAEFKPGDECERSGIYRVVHDGDHTQPHELTVVYGRKFPPCRQCGHLSRFLLVTGAQHVDSNEWFKE